MRGVKPPTPIAGLTAGDGGSIRIVGVIPGAVAVEKITALTFD
jgi:hypothetical protein